MYFNHSKVTKDYFNARDFSTKQILEREKELEVYRLEAQKMFEELMMKTIKDFINDAKNFTNANLNTILSYDFSKSLYNKNNLLVKKVKFYKYSFDETCCKKFIDTIKEMSSKNNNFLYYLHASLYLMSKEERPLQKDLFDYTFKVFDESYPRYKEIKKINLEYKLKKGRKSNENL